MALPDTLSCFKPKPGPENALDITIHHACSSPVWKEVLQLAFEMDAEMFALPDINISGWPDPTLPKSSTSWKNSFVIMAHQKTYAQIMVHSMLVLSLQIAVLNGVSPMKRPVHTTHSPIDLQSHVKIGKQTLLCAKYSGTNPRIALQHLKATPVDAKLPSPSQMLCNCQIHTTIPSRICNTDPTGSREPWRPSQACQVLCWHVLQATYTILCWSANCHIWHPEENLDTYYSSSYPSKEQLPCIHCKWNHLPPCQMPPPRMQCQMQWCWTQGFISHIGRGSYQVSQPCARGCNNHSTNTTISCTHDPRTQSCCPSFYTYSNAKGHPSAYTHLYTKCSTCATTKVRPCPHSTKILDHRDVTEEVTAPGSTNDALDPECPCIMLASCT